MTNSRFEAAMIDAGVRPIEDKKYKTYGDWRGCSGKVQYRSKESALKAIKALGDPDLNTYPCDNCGAMHIGHK